MQCVEDETEQLAVNDIQTRTGDPSARRQNVAMVTMLSIFSSISHDSFKKFLLSNFGRESCSVHKQSDNLGGVTAETTKCVCGQRERQRDQ